MSKNLLFITSRLPWPIDGGRKMSLNYYCQGLHEKYGYDIYLFCFLEKGQSYDGTHPDYIKDVYIADEVHKSEIIKNLLTKTFSCVSWPVQCSLFFSKSNFRKIKSICNEIRPQVVITEMIRTATYYEAFKKDGVKTIANLDDLLSKRYRRQAASKNSKANVAGAYSEKLPSCVNRVISFQALKSLFLKLEARKCSKWEKKFYDLYDFSMFTSPIETSEINEVMNNNKAITLSVGVDYELFSRKIEGLSKEPNTLSYVGNFKVASNKDTLKMICEEILPLIKHKYKFYVVGTCPEDIQKEYENQNIVFKGRVDDLAEHIRRTELFFSPISYGTGIKTKIVEAMAMGMPIITNDIGIEGIAVENECQLIVENEYLNLARAVDSLLENKSKMEKMGKKAQEYAYEFFRWEVVYKAFEIAGL